MTTPHTGATATAQLVDDCDFDDERIDDLFAGPGADEIILGCGLRNASGGPGDDTIVGMGGRRTTRDVEDEHVEHREPRRRAGGGGDDTIDGGAGVDRCRNGESVNGCELT